MSFIGTVAEAVLSAQKAISFDSATGNYSKATGFYTSCIAAIDEVLPQLPDDSNKTTLEQKRDLYVARLDTLNAFLGKKSTIAVKKKDVQCTPITFVEDKALSTRFMALPPPPPDDMELTTFWLGTILLGTMRRGGFLTTAIWVPKEVWDQPGEAVVDYLDKVSYLKFCAEAFQKISKSNVHNIKALTSDLESLVQDITVIHNELSDRVAGVQQLQLNFSTSRDKKIYAQRKNAVLERLKTFKDGTSSTSTAEYAENLSNVINRSASLEKVLGITADSKETEKVLDLAKKVNSFLNVVTILALNDLAALISSYFDRARDAFLTVPASA